MNHSDQWVEMTANQVLAFSNRHLKITCHSGQIWLTDGMGGEDILNCGQQIEWHTCGKICIQAFAPARVQINSHLSPEEKVA